VPLAIHPERPIMSDVEQARALFFEALEFLDANELPAAEEKLRAALRLVPGRPSAMSNLALVLLRQRKLDEAAEAARALLAVDPADVDGWLMLSQALQDRDRLGEALETLNRAVTAVPESAQVHTARGSILATLDRHDAAIADLEASVQLDPGQTDARALLLRAKMQICDWAGIEAGIADVVERVRLSRGTMSPFILLGLASSAADQLACASAHCASNYSPRQPLYAGARYTNERIRLAYVSGDFREHAVSQLLVGVLERHDRSRFEVTGISTGPDDHSALRTRVVGAFDRFIDAYSMSDTELARLIHSERTDIAIDLAGHTTGGRMLAFAHRPAPIQVGFLGYPGTSGSPCIDYLIADQVVIPEPERRHYTEAVAWLPNAYIPNDDRREIGEAGTRADEGLPSDGFVFASFNNSYKITADVFDVWMGLLRKIDGSVLWLRSNNPFVADNLRREAAARGVASERLVFADKAGSAAHLARHRLADLFLDTRYYNAHTTACDALWAGVPMLTCTGDTFPSRVATSILMALGVPELATPSMEEYVATALRLARTPPELARIRDKIAANRGTTPLFDTGLFTSHLEAAYSRMVEHHRRGEPPEGFAV
jgi:predicted O-linked N-acetylglucosamine transferase (SPINDLY family)